MTALLDEAERKTKRSIRAATLYKDEISRLTPSKSPKKKSTVTEENIMSLESKQKEAEIERMKTEIAELHAKMSKASSRTCVIS